MAILQINQNPAKQLEKFELKCLQCESKNIEIEIDWAAYPSASWQKVTLICKDCHQDEELQNEMW